MMYELAFHTMWGNPWARMFGRGHEMRRTLKDPTELRGLPEVAKAVANVSDGGFKEAVVRILVMLADNRGDVRRDRLERSNRVLNMDEPFASLTQDERAHLIHEQSLIATYEPELAVATLPDLLPDTEERELALSAAQFIAGEISEMSPETLALFQRLREVLDLAPLSQDVSEDPLASGAKTTASKSPARGRAKPAPKPARQAWSEDKPGGCGMKIENHTIDELEVGQTAELRRLVSSDDLYVFAAATGNHNPMHLPHEDGDGDGEPEAVAPSMFMASLISAALGMQLPGPGTLYKRQSLDFLGRAHEGEELVVRVTVTKKHEDGTVTLRVTEIRRVKDDAPILVGDADVYAPVKKQIFEDLEVPGLVVQRHRHFEALLEQTRALPPIATAVVCPEEANSLGGAVLAAKEGIITPILIGDPDKIAAAAQEIEADLSGLEIIEATNHHIAPRLACDLVNDGRAAAVMKGHLHTDDLLKPMLDKSHGLRMGRRFTHIFVIDVPGMPKPIMVSDAAINIAPDLATKVDIVQNAIDLAHAIGIEKPRVGVLSAVETVNPAIQSSIDAALLSKMAERGQIKGGFVDGPLAMDNAISLAAARTKGITSEVAGTGRNSCGSGYRRGQYGGQAARFCQPCRGRRSCSGHESTGDPQ